MIELSMPENMIKGRIRLSGSKSISNRLLILDKILNLSAAFQNLSDSEDTLLLKKALEQVKHTKKATIDIHHAGTDLRFLTALLAITEGEWILTGSERIKERPISELVSALKQLEAEILYLEKEGFAPLQIKGKLLKGGSIEVDSSISSQFISALLLVSPVFEKGLELKLSGQPVSKPYVDMTIALLKRFGISVDQSDSRIHTRPSSPITAQGPVYIESDWSSASYWYSLCALAGNAEIELSFLDQNSLQADAVLPEIYDQLGVRTTFKEHSIVLMSVTPKAKEFHYDFLHCPDIAQTVALSCFGLNINAKLSGLSTLKAKETDRILALKTELEKCGAQVEAGKDYLHISIPDKTQSARTAISPLISTYNDHRMAMSFAPLALNYKSIRIDDPSVVNKSYPAFWEDLKSVGFSVNLQP